MACGSLAKVNNYHTDIGMLYGYSTGTCFLNTGKCMYKAGLSTDTGNSRLNTEFGYANSIGKKEYYGC